MEKLVNTTLNKWSSLTSPRSDVVLTGTLQKYQGREEKMKTKKLSQTRRGCGDNDSDAIWFPRLVSRTEKGHLQGGNLSKLCG